jgi:hypothetical protein
MGMDMLQRHMHIMEDHFGKLQEDREALIEKIDIFLNGIDAAREILINDTEVNFDYSKFGGGQKAKPMAKNVQGGAGSNGNEYKILYKRAINLLLFQFSDLSQYLESEGKDDLLQSFKKELWEILKEEKSLKAH